MNRKIKIVRGGVEASIKKEAFEAGEIAPVALENFETLTTPPFKPKLELIEADPHTPPTMDAQTDQNITTEGDDPNQPTADDLTRKGPEYENSNAIEKHQVPHENEHVKQGSVDDIATKLAAMKAEYTQKFALASRLFDIKLAAGIEEDINRQNFVHAASESSEETVEGLKKQVVDAEGFLNQIQSSQKVARVNTSLPTGFGSLAPRKDSSVDNALEAIIFAGGLTE